MNTKNVKLYGDIAKSEDMSDGTVKVWGYASSNAVDCDGEIVTSDAMKAALPDYMKFANVREMHTSKAAGVAIEAEVQADGRTFFGAHIIDSEAVKKVRAGVYKGFSIGGKVTSRDSLNKSTVTGLRLSEVSLVDRPANPDSVFTFFKADGIGGEDDGQNADGTTKADDTIAPAAPVVETVTITKAEADEFAAYKLEKAAAARDTLLKGMSHVSQLAYMLKEMQWLVQDQQDEAAREGDASTVPAKLEAAVKGLGAILVQMTQEEVAELADRITAPVDPLDPANIIQMAEKLGDLSKAGAKFSGATKKTLGDAHEAMKAACKHLDGLAYADKADGPDDLAKVAGLSDELAKMTGERDTLAKRVKELEALPAPTKAILRVVEKGEDYTDPTLTKAEKEAESKPQTPENIMKSVHAKGAMIQTATGLRPLS